jgi:hypothetical protein
MATVTKTVVSTEAAKLPAVIHLKASPKHVEWSEGVIDNENMGKKSSKSECPGSAQQL